MKPDLDREQHCRAIDRILNAAAQRRTTPPPTAANIVDVNEQEKAMLERAEQTFASQPGLQKTYPTAEAFGRHCLKKAREKN